MNKKSQPPLPKNRCGGKDPQLKIGIDARFYGPLGKGLGRYTQRLVENLEKIDSKNKYVIFLRRENWEYFEPKNRNFKKILAPLRWYSLSEQFFMPMLAGSQEVDLMHFPHFNVPLIYQGPFVVTIHDLVLEHFPTQKASTLSPIFYKIKRAGYKKVICSSLKRARTILTPSAYTKEELVKHFKLDPARIKITYEGCGRFDLPHRDVGGRTSKILRKYGIIKPYVLYVGNAYPHKNLERLILAFQKLVKDHRLKLQLVLVGEEDYFYKRLKKYGVDLFACAHSHFMRPNEVRSNEGYSHTIFTGFVRDEELQTLYKNALLYIFPSLCEGFGLPPLEAMACGVPVVSSNKACLPEVLDDSAYYFNPYNIDEIAQAIKKVSTDEDLRRKLITKGFERAKLYSWEKMAEKTLRIYKQVLS